MKVTSILFALLVATSFSYGADEKKADKPKADPEAMFKKADANGDGKVSKEEFLKGAKDAAKKEAQFTAKDKDKDGSLSKEEFTAAGGKKKDK
jgi:Ca2+-binding EF-hand superfamily protein